MALLTERQRYVLTNLERVVPRLYRLKVRCPMRRYDLDGKECTSQITGLVVKGLVIEHSERLERVATMAEAMPVRQSASSDVLELIREAVVGGGSLETGRNRSA